MSLISRRNALKSMATVLGGTAIGTFLPITSAQADEKQLKKAWKASTDNGLKWMCRTQSVNGNWPGNSYPVAMAALAGTAMVASGSTTTQGPYSKYIRRTVDYLTGICVRESGGKITPRFRGLIGDPFRDSRYTYGHGFAMLFLSQVLGEEEDEDRRHTLTQALKYSVKFCIEAQTKAGGWGYVSAKDGSDFDEGSTTITQVQGLRGCRNAGIPVPKDAIDKAVKYIYNCQNKDGGISYSSKSRGSSRPAITAAALAGLYNAGDYESKQAKLMLSYTKGKLHNFSGNRNTFGHWHYTYLYYAQVIYRLGGAEWNKFRDRLYATIVKQQTNDGSWTGNIGPIYVTACNLIILQLDHGYLPIYQR